jgi:hypothetical protein
MKREEPEDDFDYDSLAQKLKHAPKMLKIMETEK